MRTFFEAIADVQPLYFGCKSDAGHHVWTKDGSYMYRKDFTPMAQFLASHDGQLTPKGNNKEGAAKLHHVDNGTILAFHDYTVDSRPGSNSMFWFPGNYTFEEMLQLIKVDFPWKKLPANVFLVPDLK